jgi:hypothetical protein
VADRGSELSARNHVHRRKEDRMFDVKSRVRRLLMVMPSPAALPRVYRVPQKAVADPRNMANQSGAPNVNYGSRNYGNRDKGLAPLSLCESR